jgi:membrane protease YdiL (CAAX protease family)
MNKLAIAAIAVIGGLIFFVGMVFFAVGVAQFNADSTPNLPWFPIVVWGVLFSLLFWINRKWDIGLHIPDGKPWGLITTFAVLSMIASHCVLVLEGAFHGITREFEAAPEGVSGLFAAVYWVGIVIAMSTASESAFRGIMQSKLMPLFGVWPAILIATIANTLAHRWDGLAERTIGVFAILVAWGYLRHISGSLTPTILTHIATIFAWDIILWTWGPWDHAAMGTGSLVATAVIGLVTFAGSVYVAKRI